MAWSVSDVADRMEITDKIYRYCRSVDRLDVAVGHSVFHEDSLADFSPAYKGTGRGWIDFICVEHKNYLRHSHQVTNVIIELDGDRAGSEAYVYATLHSQQGDRVIQHQFWARYVDLWSKRDGEWAIDRRDCIIDLDARQDVTPIGQSDRARRDASDPSYGAIGR